MCLISFKLSTLWLSPAGGSSPAKVANTIEFHPEIRGTAFPPRPSCRIGPVSGGRDRRCSSRRRRRPRPAAPRTPPGGRVQPQSAAARCLGPEGAAGDGDGTRQVTWVASEDFGGFRRISEDLGGLKNWEFGFRLKHILVSATCLKSVSTKKTVSTGLGSHSCEPITTSSTFKPIPSQVSAIFVDLLQALGVHLQQASDSSDVAFFCSLQDVSASKRPKLWMSGSPRFILNILYYQWISHNCIIMS